MAPGLLHCVLVVFTAAAALALAVKLFWLNAAGLSSSGFAAMERVKAINIRRFLRRSRKDMNQKTLCLLRKKLKQLSSRRRTTGRLEDTLKKLQDEYGEKKALKMVKSIVKKIRKKMHMKNGGSVRTHSGNKKFKQHNNLPQQQHNNNSTLLRQPSIQNPNQHNITIDQKDGGSILAPNMVGNTINGDVTMNLHAPQVSHSTSVNKFEILQSVKNKMKTRMKSDSERIFEGSAPRSVSLNKIYTELFIINDDSDPINREHEIWQIETTHDLNASAQTVIHYNEILQPSTEENRKIMTVLTKGIAGIGKTITVQKFVLDWASGEANQDLELVFLLPFRELNLLEGENSFFDLLCFFYPEFKEMRPISDCICDSKVLFILDGLDEYKKDLNFKSRLLSDVTEKATVDVLLVNLLRRKLLPSAHLWITSRPVAAGQLPSDIFLRGFKTQIRGFRDEQKEEYFMRQFEDLKLTKDIICHLKSQKSLWILCHIPLFCWISVVVLKDIISSENKDLYMPSNLTEMYIHYLLIQTGLSHKKYQGEELSQEDALKKHDELIMKLAELAYWQLKKQNVIFREEDLMSYNISADEAHQYPGVITCVTEYKSGYYRKKLFTFIHLSVQEFFAALFAFNTFLSGNQDSLNLITAKKRNKSNLCDFLKDIINVALQSKNGHLDLFMCFLFGISCDSSRDLLEGLLPPLRVSSSDIHEKVTTYIKSLKRKDLTPERCISLVRCLFELKDTSFFEEMQDRETSWFKEPLTQFQCSCLAFQFRMSDKKHDKFDLRKYKITLEGFERFSPAIMCFRKALLKGSGFAEQHCKSLAGYLRSPNSHLTDLDLSHNALGGSALKQLSTALCDPNCQIQILNLSHNHLQSQDMELIRDVLSGENMNLRVLDLSDNPLGDSGVKILSAGLQSTNCHLEVLKLSGCQIKEGVYQLLSSLKANPSCLRELDLRYNEHGNIGQEILKDEYLCSLRISTGGVCGPQPGLYKYAVTLTFDPQTANEYLHLNENNTVATRQKEKQQLPDNDERFDRCNQVLCRPPLPERCFFAVDVIGPDIHVGVACEGMERKGASDRVRLGRNEMSWSLYCSDNECVAQHNQKTVSIPTESIRKIGVFLDREAGSLCFYSLSPPIKLLYMFDADFPEDQDLLAAFRIQEPGCSVNLRPESL
ncbi:NACHT, LRR and PYD domains-containing protein 3-like isoform X2 [Megalobrama amblycephala]|uniref:NACHT, LRR and PYD domains-containing protein 3-like isoform X2 n=1 Tax=Megalobrama amblycephala TaxID=75352 RepID=UPI002013C966|nr:NACHT, LRR and PYD domains-containing protein 3-like isoform X2 [Megalobrama amblycephala]